MAPEEVESILLAGDLNCEADWVLTDLPEIRTEIVVPVFVVTRASS